jgi:Transmembrane domain of unknown function (DUF3566)
VSNGNVEQPTAQTPRGPNSPNRVEVSEEVRQSAPSSNAQGQERSNGQSREAREEQLAATRAGLAARARAAGASSTAQPPGSADRPQPSSAGSPSTPPIRQRNEPAQQTPQKQAPPPSTQQRQGASPPTQPRQVQSPPAQQPQQPRQVQSPPAQPAPQPQTAGQAPNTPTQAEPRNPSSPPSAPPSARPAQGAVPVWDPPPPPAPKQGFLTRLGFGRKAERPEGGQAAAPVEQPRVTPTQPPPTTPGGANTPTATTGPVAPPGQQVGEPTQPRPTPGAQPGAQPRAQHGAPAGPGAAAAAGLAAAATTQVRGPQPPAGQPGTTQVRGPQPPAGQPGTTQSPVRPDQPGGRTSAVQGGSSAPPVTPPAGPQARMPAAPVAPATRTPGPPMQPAAPSAIPAPSQERDTARNERVGAGPPVDSPEAHHLAKSKVGVARRTRKARLRLSRLDPWSVMKTSFLFSIAAGIMLVAAVYSLWTVLSTSQLFDSINQIVASVVSTPGDTTPFRIEEYINTQKVMGVTALVACVDVVIFTALATLGSFLYNLAATMLGGLEITLAED